MRRVILLVVDGLGVGELPDAADYGDAGSNTLLNAARAGSLHAPTLDRLGLGRVQPAPGLNALHPVGAYGRMAERSAGKDSMTGHREICGIVAEQMPETFPSGFPDDIVDAFSARIGRPVIGNAVMPGTDAVELYGAEALETGCPIVYTSSDSVFQVAAHVRVVPEETLYGWCEQAREVVGTRVGRVIARPFTGEPGSFERLHAGRRDYPLPLPEGSLLHLVADAGLPCVGIGKVRDLFGAERFTRAVGPGTDAEMVYAALDEFHRIDSGLVFVNCGDVDSKYGHRRDPAGWCEAFHRLDSGVAHVMEALGPDDVLIVTGDHGNDPTTPSTDHAREYVPVLACSGRRWTGGAEATDVGVRASFADVGATVASLLGLRGSLVGASFADAVT